MSKKGLLNQIKIYNRGPVLYTQKRVTRDQKEFTLYKLKTMIINADQDTGPVQASTNDKRITGIGRFLRRTRLDELPQLLNVIKGSMSFVGPRALRVEEVEEFIKSDKDFTLRFAVKAGVTGYAQVNGFYHTEYDRKLKMDLSYIADYSFFLDLMILIMTIRAVFDRDSAKGIELLENADIMNQLNLRYIQLNSKIIRFDNITMSNGKLCIAIRV